MKNRLAANTVLALLISMVFIMIPLMPTTANGNPADLNGDSKVNIDDVLIAGQAFGSDLGNSTGNWNPDADLNGDDRVRVDDVLTVALNFGWTP